MLNLEIFICLVIREVIETSSKKLEIWLLFNWLFRHSSDNSSNFKWKLHGTTECYML